MELREKITREIERAMLEDTGSGIGVQCRAAGYILSLPEIRDGQRALEGIARQGLSLLDDGSIGREYKARS